jgi:hypothetical protein
MRFKHYRTADAQNIYFGITLDRYKPTKFSGSTWTIDLHWGHHLFVAFWGNR